MIFTKIQDFIGREWKKILILIIVATAYQLFAFSFLYKMDPEMARESYQKLGGFFRYATKGIIEFTITYYVLIYVAWLPLLQKRKVARFFILVVGMFVLKAGYSLIFEFQNVNFKVDQGQKAMTEFIRNNKLLFYVLSMGVAYVFTLLATLVVAVITDFNHRSKRQKELEKQKLDAELSAIKYQINPHFLFNSLSFIYSKTVPLSEEVSNAVLLLSDIMRYALGKEEDPEGKVALIKEITHMKNVIEINQMRFNNKLSIQYAEQLQNHSARITPLVLITLVENAFKHGDLLDPANPLVIRTESDDQQIRFYIRNKKKSGPKELSTNIGLNNVKQRLQLMYGDKYSLGITDTEHFYTTELTINL
jgi:LytS/YehU family sensor histidine kinase